MTSKERRDGRYQRRKAERENKRRSLLDRYNFDAVKDPKHLYKAMKQSRKGVYWKASVQRYDMSYLRRIAQSRDELCTGKDIRKGFYTFYTEERGKRRYIRSVHFTERVIQKSFCTHALAPHLIRTLIYDNGASVANKGIHFSIKRMKVHLMRHYRKHGRDGYVLLIDFSNYFGNIEHKPLIDQYRRAFGEDKRLLWLASLFVTAFGDKSLGLGSETSQISAIAYVNEIDHYALEVLRIVYAHYMDDSYSLHAIKQAARDTAGALSVKYDKLGIVTTPEKTNIVKLSQGFTFIKVKFSITETGRIVARPSRKGITRQRQKLNKFKKLYDAGLMTLAEIRNGYMSWRGYIKHLDAGRTIYNMDMLYLRLFKIHPLQKL